MAYLAAEEISATLYVSCINSYCTITKRELNKPLSILYLDGSVTIGNITLLGFGDKC
jgi:hypothetical protein